jgi:hypothetical protein
MITIRNSLSKHFRADTQQTQDARVRVWLGQEKHFRDRNQKKLELQEEMAEFESVIEAELAVSEHPCCVE